MKKNTLLVTAFLVLATLQLHAQEKKKFKIHTVAFYNLENLFDTINDPTKNDEASPIMEMKIKTGDIYKRKVHNMARVIADVGYESSHNAPAILGVSEVENRDVLEDVVNDPLLLEKDYGIVHYGVFFILCLFVRLDELSVYELIKTKIIS